MSWGQIVRIALLIAGAALAWFGWGVHRDGKNGDSLDAYREVTRPIARIHAQELRLKGKGSVEFEVPRSPAWLRWSGGEQGRQFMIQGLANPRSVIVCRNGGDIRPENINGTPAFNAKPGDRVLVEVETASDSEIVVEVPWDYGYADSAAMTDALMSIVGGLLMFFGAVLSLITLTIWVVIARRRRAATSAPT